MYYCTDGMCSLTRSSKHIQSTAWNKKCAENISRPTLETMSYSGRSLRLVINTYRFSAGVTSPFERDKISKVFTSKISASLYEYFSLLP